MIKTFFFFNFFFKGIPKYAQIQLSKIFEFNMVLLQIYERFAAAAIITFLTVGKY